MKKTIVLAMALIMGMAFAPMAEAAVNEVNMEMAAPAKKKTTKKKTTKKTTTKTSTKSTKKTTTSKKTTTTAAPVAQTEPLKKTTETTKASSENNSGSLLGGIISAVAGAATGSGNGSSVLSGLPTIFNSALGATKDRIVGTWTYTEPAVVFSSNNVLQNIGGKVASSAIEKQLQQQFEKAGIRKGSMKMTFDKDGNFTQTLGGRTLPGTYTVEDTKIVLSYAGGIKQLVGTTQLDGNDLLIVMDASKLLKYANTIGTLTGNTTLKSLGNLLGSYNGMEVGMKLNK